MPTYTLTEDQLRRIVFAASVAYATALQTAKSVQEAEWERKATMYAELDKIVRRSPWKMPL